MRSKRLLILFFFGLGISFVMFSQDSLANVEPKVFEEVKYTNDVNFDSLLQVVPIDTSRVATTRSFSENLSEKYASDSDLDYERNTGKSFMQKLKEWINNILRKLIAEPDTSNIDKITEIILDIIYVAIFLVVVYIIVRLVMNHRGKWFFEKKNETLHIDLSNVEQHIHEADFGSMLNEAEHNDNTRQAVRLLYLWLLKTFSDKGIIEWDVQKTNIDYLSEIKSEQLQNEFRYLSYLYNYIWYGEFSINDSEYRDARDRFRKHIQF